MKTAKLVKQGKGWVLEGEKTQPVPGDFGLTDDMNGQEVEYDNSGGPVKLIRYNRKDYTKTQQQNMEPRRDHRHQGQYGYQRQNPRGHQYQRDSRPENDPARAPYNFVPLNQCVLHAEDDTDPSQHLSLSGYIDLQIEALTPLFVKNIDGQFFRINDIPFIPGSTCRGLTRNLVEIVGYGRLSFFQDRQLYRRSNLTTDGNHVEAGFLVFADGRFKVHKAQSKQERNSNIRSPHVYQFEDSTCTFSTGRFASRMTIWKFSNREPSPIEVPPMIIESYNSDDTRAEGVIDIFKSAKNSRIYDKNGEIIQGNQDSRPTDLTGIPIFFRKDEAGKIISVGHAKYHRVPYSNSIGDHISQDDVESGFGNVIFGSDKVAGKVFFEDLKPIDPQIQYELETKKRPKILSSPKPTTYQHYLEQPNGILTNQRRQHDWSTQNSRIRGHKQYWHRKTSSNQNDPNTWIETGNVTKSHPDPINPVSVGTTFYGRIRFKNLTKQELGVLLFVLDLPEDCAHKLGMGKPLGLGSVKISASLTLIDRHKRYSALFNENTEWESGESKEEDLKKFKDAFAQYIGEKLPNPDIVDADSYWACDERMKELKHMLILEHNMGGASVNWNSRTRYMEIERMENGSKVNDYKNRPVLPKPSEVVQPNTYKKS